MSTKFFTWTKGDRRNASGALRTGGLVPISTEGILMDNVEYNGRTKLSSKSTAKPHPLALEAFPHSSLQRDNRTANSMALHDAAVQSATNLMSVMNDMLRSPPMTAHLFSQTYPPSLKPADSRTRSQTTPSTPYAEAPYTHYVELPGSFPSAKEAPYGLPKPSDAIHPHIEPDCDTAIGANHSSPHSKSQESLRILSRKSFSAGLERPAVPIHHHEFEHTYVNRSSSPRGQSYSSTDETLVSTNRERLRVKTRDPIYSPLSPSTTDTGSLPPSLSPSRTTSDILVPLAIEPDTKPQDPNRLYAPSDSIHELSHSHGSPQKRHEKQFTPMSSSVFCLDDLQSKASDRGGYKVSQPQSAAAGMKQVHCCCCRMRDCNESSYGRSPQNTHTPTRVDNSCAAARDGERSVQRLRATIRKAKENERALKNSIAALEARLVAANNERLDVLEGYEAACDRLDDLCSFEPTLRQRLQDADLPWQQKLGPRQQNLASGVRIERSGVPIAEPQASSPLGDRLVMVEAELAQHKQMLAFTRADCGRDITQKSTRYQLNVEGYREELHEIRARAGLSHDMEDSIPPAGDRDYVDRKDSVSPRSSPTRERKRPSQACSHQRDSPGGSAGLGITCTSPSRARDTLDNNAVASFPDQSAPRTPAAGSASPTVSRAASSPRPLSNIDKRLPSTPIIGSVLPTTPPPTDRHLQRTATLRSLSESIISSYAKRTTS